MLPREGSPVACLRLRCPHFRMLLLKLAILATRCVLIESLCHARRWSQPLPRFLRAVPVGCTNSQKVLMLPVDAYPICWRLSYPFR